MVDLASLFEFRVAPLELVMRGTLMYWFLFLLFRFVLRRDVGAIAIADILVLVLIADAAQSAMAGGYETISEGCLLVATIAGWNYFLDWLSYRFESVRRLLAPAPLMLVRDGRLLRGNLRREMVTIDELNSKLREQGIESLEQVKEAYMESDGEISVIRHGNGGEDAPKASHRKTAGG